MEVYFLDVGQGACHVALLGGRRAIVVDSGPSTGGILSQLLQRYEIEYIEILATTHSHNDHSGGAIELLTTYAGRIGTIALLKDSSLFSTEYWARLRQLIEDGEIREDQLLRIEVTDSPRTIFHDSDLDIALKAYSPTLIENLTAEESEDSNATSAIFAIERGSSRLIMPGDATMDQWRALEKRQGGPLKCQVLVAPHHGGKIGATDSDLQWLYSHAIKADCTVISVGTSNTYKHPLPTVVSSIRGSGSHVLCTQITKQCCNDLEELRPGVQRFLHPVRRSLEVEDLTSTGNSRNVACAGTVVVDVSASKAVVRYLSSHQRGIKRLLTSGGLVPLCQLTHSTTIST